jgi:DNA-binding NtrC family response regulator/pSer/pThr/pTyr-binding forkhead associated (FHA) protein
LEKSMSRIPPNRSPSGKTAPVGPATATTLQAQDHFDGTLRALYITGPKGGARHLLPDGLVRLGRSQESTIVVDDPRVSRCHAALHVQAAEMMLSDLDSANGTFLGSERLRPGDARPLAPGQTFFLGDSALVVRPTSLKRRCDQRLSSFEQVRDRLLSHGDATARMIVVRVRPHHVEPPIVEAILGEILSGEGEWMWWARPSLVFLGIAGSSQADAPRCERVVAQQLLSWGVTADVESRHFTPDQVERSGDGVQAWFESDAPLALDRDDVVIRDPAMAALHHTIARIAPAPINVLILGETGVGKEVVAAMVHERSTRAAKPFVRLNCASVPEALLESELFGYERGAFTGATASKPGLLETADGGTVFLDEVGELPLSVQAKMLRAIESRETMRLGAVKARSIDVRFVAATNRDLPAEVAEGRFRRDLYYRLNGVTMLVPPLRERPSEIEPLARLFLRSACARFGTGERTIEPATMEALTAYPWPGNARELRNVIERAVLLTPETRIEPGDLRLPSVDLRTPEPLGRGASNGVDGVDGEESASATDSERERLRQALLLCGGNQSRAAKMLGIPRRTLVRLIARLGLPRPRETGAAASRTVKH